MHIEYIKNFYKKKNQEGCGIPQEIFTCFFKNKKTMRLAMWRLMLLLVKYCLIVMKVALLLKYSESQEFLKDSKINHS